MKYTLDATNKSLGRLASQAASILMGKNSTSFVRNQVSENTVEITNASKLKIDPKKLEQKTYTRYSGYPGGLTVSKMAKVANTKGYREIVTMAVKGMLPDNKLKKSFLKNLTVTE
jgi:large subunit ribosomal protein L13